MSALSRLSREPFMGNPRERSHLPFPGFVLGVGLSIALWLGLGASLWLMLARRWM